MTVNVKVLATKNFYPGDLDYIRSRLDKGIRLVIPRSFDDTEIAGELQQGIEVILGEPPSGKALSRAGSLRLIQVPWTGVDRLDFDTLKKHPFVVCNSHSNSPAVAELAVSLMLSAAKMIPVHDRYMRKGKWCRPGDTFFSPPGMVSGKTAAIIGFGAIGQDIARLLGGFSMELLAVAARHRDSTPPPLTRIVQPEGLPDIAAAADFIFVCLPLTGKTCGMIDEVFFNTMKKSAYIINVSRGKIVDEDALYRALKNETIAGAAIDTWYNYPRADRSITFPSEKLPFQELDNLVMSPHRGGYIKDRIPHLDAAIENINRFASGKPLKNIVDLSSGY